MNVWIQINGEINSRGLWSIIGKYGVNVTDLGKSTFVYGDCADGDIADTILSVCRSFGSVVDAQFYEGGVAYEQKEEMEEASAQTRKKTQT